jgi:hypothetical protein
MGTNPTLSAKSFSYKATSNEVTAERKSVHKIEPPVLPAVLWI